jgi:anti-sigma-K factor RskA
MSYDGDIPIETLALYAMRLLEPEEHAEVESWLRHSPASQQELAQVMSDLAAFAVTAEMHSPPALARQRMLKQIARERKAGPFKQSARTAPTPFTPTPFAGYAAQTSAYAAHSGAQPSPTPQRAIQNTRRAESAEDDGRSGFGVAMAYLGWALAAGLAFTLFVQYNMRIGAENNMRIAQNEMVRDAADSAQARAVMETLTDPTAQRITLMKQDSPPSGPCGKAIYMPDKGMLTFIATGLDPLQPYKTYELWLIPADGRDPIPAGTFKPDDRGNASVLMPELPKGVPARSFGVTIEDDGGAQTPSMPIVLAGGA